MSVFDPLNAAQVALEDAGEIRGRIAGIVAQSQTESQREAALATLARDTQLNPKAIKEIADQIAAESDLAESRTAIQKEIQAATSLEAAAENFDIAQLFTPKIANGIKEYAKEAGNPAISGATTFLTAAASVLPRGTRLRIRDRFEVPSIIYSMKVAPTGNKKTPDEAPYLDPLREMDAAKYKDFSDKHRNWEGLKKEERGEEPKRRSYLIQEGTLEGVARVGEDQPNKNVLWGADEIDGLLSSQNQYRNGGGNDKHRILENFNGRAWDICRATGRRTILCNFSITGTIQPDILRERLGNGRDSAGEWGRFLPVVIKPKFVPFEIQATKNISESISAIYTHLSQLYADPQAPEEEKVGVLYTLSPEATTLYAAFYNEVGQKQLTEPHPGLASVLGKMQGYCGRLALVLHCINGVDGGSPNPQISPQTMQAAINLAWFYFSQWQLIYSESEDCDALAPNLRRVLKIVERHKGEYLTVRQVREKWANRKTRPTAATLRDWFAELIEMRLVEGIGLGTRLKVRVKTEGTTLPPTTPTTLKNSESLTEQGLKVEGSPTPKVPPTTLNFGPGDPVEVRHPTLGWGNGYFVVDIRGDQVLIFSSDDPAQTIHAYPIAKVRPCREVKPCDS